MPIDTDSEKWKSGGREDPLEVALLEHFSNNQDEAYTLEEITEIVTADHSDQLFLPDDVEDEIDDETRSLVKTRIAATLERLSWRHIVEWRLVDDGDGKEAYFTDSDKKAIFPIAKVHDEFPGRFNSIEDELDDLSDDIDELNNRLYRVEQEDR